MQISIFILNFCDFVLEYVFMYIEHVPNRNDTSNIYGFSPNYTCCLSNMHSPWLRYAESMWMATADKGLVAMLYGPCRFEAKVADGKTVEVTQETDYPFSDTCRITVHCKEAVKFPLHFRIPSWAGQGEVSIAGDPSVNHPQGGTVLKLDRAWKDGDVVTLNSTSRSAQRADQTTLWRLLGGRFTLCCGSDRLFQSIPWIAVDKTYRESPKDLGSSGCPRHPALPIGELRPSQSGTTLSTLTGKILNAK